MSIYGRLFPFSFFVFICVTASMVSFATAYDLSISSPRLQPVRVSGTMYVVKNQTPDTLTVSVAVFCDNLAVGEDPPDSLTVQYALIRGSHEVSVQTATATSIVWDLDLLAGGERTTVSYDLSLPVTGTGSAELSTGTYLVEARLMSKVVIDSHSSPDFTYTVYSGILKFSDVVTEFSTLIPAVDMQDCGADLLLDPAMSYNWDSGQNSYAFSGASASEPFCVSENANSDGFSTDLLLDSGSVAMGTVSGETAGIAWLLYSVVLDSSGGGFPYLSLDLQDTATYHPYTHNQVWPTGISIAGQLISNSGSSFSFTSSLDEITVSIALTAPQRHYYHNQGLPFYVSSTGFTYALAASNTDGLVLSNPKPYYVHQDAFVSLASGDTTSMYGFPGNDVIFREASLVRAYLNTAHINEDGISGHLEFHGNVGHTAFPYATLDHPHFGIDFSAGELAAGSSIITDESDPIFFAVFPDPSCKEKGCSETSSISKGFNSKSLSCAVFNDGSLVSRFTNFGDRDIPDASRLLWGGYDGTDFTFRRTDADIRGVWVVPGFRMPGTAATPTTEGSHTLAQVLLGSRTFTEPAASDLPLTGAVLHPLNLPTDSNSFQGNGFFPGVNMGPEILLPVPAAGVGAFLNAGLGVRFNGNNAFASMPDRTSTKYNLRKGGITGVFNTGFNGASDGDVSIYGYNINFSRFNFSQTLNSLSSRNLIDGELTLHGPVGGGDGLRVAFTDLAFFCDGNLGSGTLDTESEPDWPRGDAASATGCDGVNSDGDSNTDESCHVLDYWNMPILMTGMTFAAPTAAAPCLNGGERKLHLSTLNLVDGLATPLTMEADYEPDGSLSNQRLFTAVDNIIDQPLNDTTQPGFAVRIKNAYLNQVADASSVPSWQGFTVVDALIDVPLFNDSPVSSHLVNQPDQDTLPVYIFEQAADIDQDGIQSSFDTDDNDAAVGGIGSFRAHLDDIEPASPKPRFEYQWPNAKFINLSYHAGYQPAGQDTVGKFVGIPKDTDLAGVASVTSVADYITPQRTKFSFGIQADIEALGNLSFDAGLLTDGVGDFLENSLGVNLDFDIDGMIGSVTSAEELMNDITGGDITELITDSLDSALREGLEEQGSMAYGIKTVVNTLNDAHQAPYILSSILAEPFEDVIAGITDILADPDFDFSPFAVDVTIHEDLVNALSPLLKYDHEQLRTLYDAYADATNDPPFDDLLADYLAMQSSIDELFAQLDKLQQAKERAQSFLTDGAGTAGTTIDDIIAMGYTASEEIHNLYITVTAGLGPYISNDNANPVRVELHAAKLRIREVRNAIASVHLGEIADGLYVASLILGSPMDVSILHAAEDTATNAVAELDAIIDSADATISELLDSMQLSDILDPLNEFLGDDGLLQHSLRDGIYGQPVGAFGLIGLLDSLKVTVETELVKLTADMDDLHDLLITLRPGNSLPAAGLTNWLMAVDNAQTDLDDACNSLYTRIVLRGNSSESALFAELSKLPDHNFATVFVGQLETEAESTVQRVLCAPVTNLLEATNVQVVLEQIFADIVSILPNPSEEDIRTMIRSAIVNQDQIEAINRAFFEHLGFVSDIVDQVATNLISQINSMIRVTIAHLKEEMQKQIDDVVADIGPGTWGIQSAGIDGYALVSQDEVEKIHLEAEFSFDAEPEPTAYNAALDIATWNSGENASGCSSVNSEGKIDFAISTHDVTARMLGKDIGLREALLGFTMDTVNDYPFPRGIFGRVYTFGEIKFEAISLYDLGLEAGFGADQNYFAATGAGHFTDFELLKAALFVGHTCAGNNVLERLDPQVYELTGLSGSLTGVYARGSMEMPIWSNGCTLTMGVGADIGAWYFSEPGSGTYGGLLGGSAYGELGCLASLKGALTLVGQKSGSEYMFHGDAWGAAGIGYCSASKWKSVRDARKDSYCLTGDASLSVDYTNGEMEFGKLDYNCCD